MLMKTLIISEILKLVKLLIVISEMYLQFVQHEVIRLLLRNIRTGNSAALLGGFADCKGWSERNLETF